MRKTLFRYALYEVLRVLAQRNLVFSGGFRISDAKSLDNLRGRGGHCKKPRVFGAHSVDLWLVTPSRHLVKVTFWGKTLRRATISEGWFGPPPGDEVDLRSGRSVAEATYSCFQHR